MGLIYVRFHRYNKSSNPSKHNILISNAISQSIMLSSVIIYETVKGI
ncbi:MAG: hypothetical protein E6508_04500 [Veillonella sp.]|nr:hypothetical protein [Veillonella sp.]